MGGKPSVEEKKEVDSNGNVNNNIVLHNSATLNVQLESCVIVVLAVIAAVLIIFLLLFVYYKHRHGLKKLYTTRK